LATSYAGGIHEIPENEAQDTGLCPQMFAVSHRREPEPSVHQQTM